MENTFAFFQSCPGTLGLGGEGEYDCQTSRSSQIVGSDWEGRLRFPPQGLPGRLRTWVSPVEGRARWGVTSQSQHLPTNLAIPRPWCPLWGRCLCAYIGGTQLRPKRGSVIFSITGWRVSFHK